MVKIITGKKGTGKTKILIDMINDAAKNTDGYVVCIDKGTKLRYDISTSVRIIDTDHCKVHSFDAFYGLVVGMLEANYDIKEVFVDTVLKVCGADYEALAAMLNKIEAFTGENVEVVFTVSVDNEELPESVLKYIVK